MRVRRSKVDDWLVEVIKYSKDESDCHPQPSFTGLLVL